MYRDYMVTTWEGEAMFIYNDGGRARAGYKGSTGDCVARAIAIATELDYQTVYDAINERALIERRTARRRGRSSARTGVYKALYKKWLADLGWQWHPTMAIGQGARLTSAPMSYRQAD
jgi:hypothetical protein